MSRKQGTTKPRREVPTQSTVQGQVAVERERALRALYTATDEALMAATPAEASRTFISALKRCMAI